MPNLNTLLETGEEFLLMLEKQYELIKLGRSDSFSKAEKPRNQPSWKTAAWSLTGA